MNPGGQPSNRQRDRIGKTRLLFVRQRDRVDPVRLAVNVTGSIIADRGITVDTYSSAEIETVIHAPDDGSVEVVKNWNCSTRQYVMNGK